MGNLTALLKSKTARTVFLLLAAAILLLCAWKVFGGKAEESYEPTKQEARLSGLLEEIGGISSARAMIAEEGGKVVSVIVVFEGENSILTRSRIMDVAAAALGIPKANVQVYPAEK